MATRLACFHHAPWLLNCCTICPCCTTSPCTTLRMKARRHALDPLLQYSHHLHQSVHLLLYDAYLGSQCTPNPTRLLYVPFHLPHHPAPLLPRTDAACSHRNYRFLRPHLQTPLYILSLQTKSQLHLGIGRSSGVQSLMHITMIGKVLAERASMHMVSAKIPGKHLYCNDIPPFKGSGPRRRPEAQSQAGAPACRGHLRGSLFPYAHAHRSAAITEISVKEKTKLQYMWAQRVNCKTLLQDYASGMKTGKQTAAHHRDALLYCRIR